MKEILELAALGASVCGIVILIMQANSMAASLRATKKQLEIGVFLEISRRYEDVYQEMVNLRANPIPCSQFLTQYPTSESRVGSPEWARLRRVASFFEFAGIMVKRKSIDPALLFSMVNIHEAIFKDHQMIIDDMRNTHYKGLWVNWEYLVKLRKKYPEDL